MKFEFNYKDAPVDTILSVSEALNNNVMFGLQSKRNRVVVFIPEHNAIIYPGLEKQVCVNRKAFEAVLGMTLYAYNKFITINSLQQPEYRMYLLSV